MSLVFIEKITLKLHKNIKIWAGLLAHFIVQETEAPQC